MTVVERVPMAILDHNSCVSYLSGMPVLCNVECLLVLKQFVCVVLVRVIYKSIVCLQSLLVDRCWYQLNFAGSKWIFVVVVRAGFCRKFAEGLLVVKSCQVTSAKSVLNLDNKEK